MGELVKPLVIGRSKTKVACWFKRYGCQGDLRVITKFADGSRVDDNQSVCSECGVIYIGDRKKAAEAEPTISFKVNWLNNHRDIMERAKQRSWKQRLPRLLLRRKKPSA